MLVKIHDGSRLVIAVCDSELIGKKFEQEIEGTVLQLDLTGDFFKGEEMTEEETREIIEDGKREDACFNIIGEKSCKLAKEIGIVEEEGIKNIEGVAVALVLI